MLGKNLVATPSTHAAPLLCMFVAVAAASCSASAATHTVCRLVGNNTPSAGLCTLEILLPEHVVDRVAGTATLYFNFGRKPAPSGQGSTAAGFEHVNGDLFKITLDPEGVRDWPTQLLIVASGAIRNISDMPAGFFFVQHGEAGDPPVLPLSLIVDIGAIPRPGSDQSVAGAVPRYDARAQQGLPILPQPRLTKTSSGALDLAGLPMVAAPGLQVSAQALGNAITRAGGPPVETTHLPKPGTPRITLRTEPGLFDPESTPAARSESYRIRVDPEIGVEIVGGGAAGVFYGVQSLAALLDSRNRDGSAPATSIGSLTIEDSPHFEYRGLHLDVARNFQDAATVRKLLDLMGQYKLNRFHFHLTDDEGWRLDIGGLPELVEVGGRRGYTHGFSSALPPSFGSGPELGLKPGSGFYSRSEFIELLNYASERHIQVIPEIDLPGHARAAIAAMRVRHDRLLAEGRPRAAQEFLLRAPDDSEEYESVQMWNDNVVDVRLPSSTRFVEHVVGELAAMYEEAGLELSLIHFGGDEVPEGCWGQGDGSKTTKHELFSQFMLRCADTARSHGAQLAGWEEVFLDTASDGRPSETLRSGVCYAWNNLRGSRREDAAYRLANAGTNVVLCNATHLYFDLAYSRQPGEVGYYWAGTTDVEKVFRFRPYTHFDGLEQDRIGRRNVTPLKNSARDKILGMQGHLWGENLTTADRLEYMAFPRVLALAERAWSGPAGEPPRSGVDDRRSWPAFYSQLQDFELPRLAERGVGFRRPASSPNLDDKLNGQSSE